MTIPAVPPRCLIRGCPVRFPAGSGPDRYCQWHEDESGTIWQRLEEFAMPMAAPGDDDWDDDDQHTRR